MTKSEILNKVKQHLHGQLGLALMDLEHMLDGPSIPEHSDFTAEVIKRLKAVDEAKSLWATADYVLEHIDND